MFERIVMQTVEPVNAIAPIVLILMNSSAVAGSGLVEFIFRKRCSLDFLLNERLILGIKSARQYLLYRE
jgi:hypothetical protein